MRPLPRWPFIVLFGSCLSACCAFWRQSLYSKGWALLCVLSGVLHVGDRRGKWFLAAGSSALEWGSVHQNTRRGRRLPDGKAQYAKVWSYCFLLTLLTPRMTGSICGSRVCQFFIAREHYPSVYETISKVWCLGWEKETILASMEHFSLILSMWKAEAEWGVLC